MEKWFAPAPFWFSSQAGGKNLHNNQFIVAASQTNLFCMLQTGFPFRLRRGVFEMIVVIVEMRISQMIGELASRHGVCGQTGIGTGLIQSQGDQKEANIPRLGRIGASFSPWQSQLGETSTTREIWKQGASGLQQPWHTLPCGNLKALRHHRCQKQWRRNCRRPDNVRSQRSVPDLRAFSGKLHQKSGRRWRIPSGTYGIRGT